MPAKSNPTKTRYRQDLPATEAAGRTDVHATGFGFAPHRPGPRCPTFLDSNPAVLRSSLLSRLDFYGHRHDSAEGVRNRAVVLL
jgi:hypothetical protein